MNREALSKRLEGLSSVFSADTRIAKDLKAMSYVLANMPDDKFSNILNADYDAEEIEAQGGPGSGFMVAPQTRGRYVPMRQRTPEPRGKKDIFYIEDIIKSKIPDAQKVEKIKGILSPEVTPEKAPASQPAKTADEEKESAFPIMMRRRVGPGGHMPDGTGPYGRGMGPGMGRADGTGLGDNILTIIMAPDGDNDEKLQKIKGLVSPQEEEDVEEETACKYANEEGKVEGGYWNKQASAAVLNHLVREVTGMEKVIPYNTKRQLTPDETPDGKHDKVPQTPSSLKTDQTPDQTDVIDSDIYDKSKVDKVRKEAGSKKGPGKPDGTGPHGGTDECQMKDDKEADEKDYEIEPGRQPQEEGDIEEKHKEVEEEDKKDKEAAKDWDPGKGQNAPGGSMNNPNKPAKELLKEKTSGLEEMKKEKRKKSEEKAEKLEDKAKKDISKAQKSLEKAEDIEEKTKEMEKGTDKDSAQTTYLVDGIELVASMEEANLEENEASKLSELYK